MQHYKLVGEFFLEHLKQEGLKALGRSPEEKVKGHSGAIYRYKYKYWYRTSRCYTSNMKALDIVLPDKKIF